MKQTINAMFIFCSSSMKQPNTVLQIKRVEFQLELTSGE